MQTVTASEARANFSKLGEEIVRTGKPVTVFKNSKPWLAIVPLSPSKNEPGIDLNSERELTIEEMGLLSWTDSFIGEYKDVFEALSK